MARLLADLTPLPESPAFRRLWIGNALSAVGGQLTLVAVSLEVYALTGSGLYVGLLGAFALVPLVQTGLYGFSIADAHDRRKVAVASALLLWAATAAIAAQAWLGVDNVWVLYGLVAGGIGEGWTLLFGGIACVVAATELMRWEPGFLRYDARSPRP